MLVIAAIVIDLLILIAVWETLRRFSCLNCLLGLVFVGIGVAVLVIGGFLHLQF